MTLPLVREDGDAGRVARRDQPPRRLGYRPAQPPPRRPRLRGAHPARSPPVHRSRALHRDRRPAVRLPENRRRDDHRDAEPLQPNGAGPAKGGGAGAPQRGLRPRRRARRPALPAGLLPAHASRPPPARRDAGGRRGESRRRVAPRPWQGHNLSRSRLTQTLARLREGKPKVHIETAFVATKTTKTTTSVTGLWSGSGT